MTLRIIEGFDWLPTTDDNQTIISLLGAAQYYQAGSWFDIDGMAEWRVSEDTAFDYGKALQINYVDAQFNTLNRMVYPVLAKNEGWQGYRCFIGADHTGYIGAVFMDAINGLTHLTIRCAEYGMIKVYRGTSRETLLATSAPGSFYTNEWFFLEVRAKIADVGGLVEVRINTKTVISLVDADTCNGIRPLFDLVGFQGRTSSGSEAWTENIKIDDWYYCDGDGTVNKGFLGNVRVKTMAVIEAGTSTDFVVAGSQPLATLGERTDRTGNIIRTNVSPYNAYNTLLRRVLVGDNTTITEIRFTPSDTATNVSTKPVVYADNLGKPGALIASGAANLGFTANVEEILTLATSPAVTAGTYYWIGLVMSTNTWGLSPYVSSTELIGYVATSSYDAPGVLSALSVAPEVAFYAVTSTLMENWQAVQNEDMGETSYVRSSTVGDYDLYDLDPSINAPFVHGIQARLGMRQDDATQRIAQAVVQIPGGTASEGQDFYLNQSFSIYRDIFELNPDTGVFYSGTEANDAQVGPKVVT